MNYKWSYEACYKEAKKYKTRTEFQRGSSGAYAAALRNGWLNDYTWLVDGKVKLYSDRKDSVYIYLFEKNNAVYVGRSIDLVTRDWEHRHKKGAVYEYSMKYGIEIPPMQIIEQNLTVVEGLDREDYWRKWYTDNGYIVLNRAKTGVGSGSLGSIAKGKWTRVTCYEEAKKYKTRSEFSKGSSGAYKAALVNGWLDDYTWFKRPKPSNYKWTYEACREEAKKYKTRTEFCRGCKSAAYNVSRRNGWLDDWFPVCSSRTKS